ncbi:MAG TPA: glycosyltransferase family 2 protein, partial [Anaerolineales bacterium]|nr:glycosyltransferase family 2 protein [Anaerolineales bacterium]
TLQGMIWRLKTAAFKQRISLEDRFGWYAYADWIRDFEKPPPEISIEKHAVPGDAAEPRFSLVLYAGEGTDRALERTLGSISVQTCPAWEVLVLPPMAPPDRADPRVRRLHPVEGRPPIALALEAARGDFLLSLEVGDTLAPEALSSVFALLDRSPEAEGIYTDEDHLAADGRREAPFFKPDWSPVLLLSVPYLDRAYFSRRLLLEAAAMLPEDELDWEDLVFACAGRARQILHIPEVLVHTHASPTRSAPADRCRLIEAYLQRAGISEPSVEVVEGGVVRAAWPVKGEGVSVIVPTQDRVEYLRRCVESIHKLTAYPAYEIILVDSGSVEPETLEYYASLQGIPNVRIVSLEGEFNFSRALNLGVRESNGSVLLFLNNDTEAVEDGWLEELVRWAERPEIGAVGGQLLFPDGSIQHAGIVIGMEGHATHIFGGSRPDVGGPFGPVTWYRNYSAVTGACMAMRREVFDEISGFDEGYRLVFSDIEICLRVIRAGYRVVYTPFARLIHHEGKTRQRYIPPEDIVRAYEHLKDWVAAGDPYFNPNLSTAVRTPTFRRPGEQAAIERLRDIVEYSI